MALFRFRWLRRFVRRNTAPIDYSTADKWKRRLSFAYALAAWNAMGLVMYQIYKGKSDWATYHGLPADEGTKAQQYAKILGVDKAKVVKISGLSFDTYEIDNSAENTVNMD